MNIGIISDIHGWLSPTAKDALAGSDAIICAGDTEDPIIIWELETIAPTYAVLGNCDHAAGLVHSLRAVIEPKIAGVRFHVVHRPEDVHALADDVMVVVHGHTHVPRDEMRNGVRWLNPGSPTRPRGGSDASVIRMVADSGRILGVDFVTV